MKNIDLYLEINTTCNIKCSYCYNSDRPNKNKNISLEQVDEIRVALKSYKINSITISGGDLIS